MPDPGLTDHLPPDFETTSLRQDVLRGLTATPKWLPPKWFYDKVGSELFEEITRLPEYYPTRTERSILTRHAPGVIDAADPVTLVELGSGSSEKTRLLLDALTTHADRRGRRAGYVALDVSADALLGAQAALRQRYPGLRLQAVRADFTHQLDRIPADGPRLVAFLGSTIGNFEPAERAEFLAALRAQLTPGEHFLLGADLVKPVQVLLPAYDDAAGVTAAFNRNVLAVIAHRLAADLDPDQFDHVARWDTDQEWIEMWLRARQPMTVRVEALDLTVTFAAGEELRTEISAKFRPDRLAGELAAAGFTPAGWWTDSRQWFSLSLWRAA